MTDDSQAKSQVNWKFFAWVGGGLLVFFGYCTWAFIIPHLRQRAAAALEQAATAAQTQLPAAAEPVRTGPAPRGCYVGQKPNFFHKTAQTRKGFADENTKQLYEITGSDAQITATAAGNDSEILLYSTAPENSAEMKKLVAAFKPNPSVRDQLCVEGFAEVQFILRDETMKQTLVTKWQTSLVEMMRHTNQNYGSSPMQ